jgi:hypothetical protein
MTDYYRWKFFGIKINVIGFILPRYFLDHFLFPVFFFKPQRIPLLSKFGKHRFALEENSWPLTIYIS